MLLSIALILLVGMSMGWLCRKMKLPGLLGMLATGIVLGPYVLDLLDPSILGISAELRKIALIIILTRAGLGLDLSGLKKIGRPAVLMCFVPASFELFGMLLLAPKLSIFEFLVTGQNNDFCVRKLLADQTAQFQAVHKRHPDIGDHDIRTQFLDHGIGQLSVAGLPTELIAMSLPVNIIFDSFTDDKFILHQKHF